MGKIHLQHPHRRSVLFVMTFSIPQSHPHSVRDLKPGVNDCRVALLWSERKEGDKTKALRRWREGEVASSVMVGLLLGNERGRWDGMGLGGEWSCPWGTRVGSFSRGMVQRTESYRTAVRAQQTLDGTGLPATHHWRRSMARRSGDGCSQQSVVLVAAGVILSSVH